MKQFRKKIGLDSNHISSLMSFMNLAKHFTSQPSASSLWDGNGDLYLTCCIYFCFIDYAKAFDCVNHNKLWKILKQMGILWETYMQVRKQQLELDMEQQTGSK